MSTVTSTVWPGAILDGKVIEAEAPILSPVSKTSEYDVVHVQVPIFFNLHVFLNVAPGSYLVPSGTVTSAMNCARSVHACAAETLAGNAAAGKADNTSANNNRVETTLTRDFIGSSSILHPIDTTYK